MKNERSEAVRTDKCETVVVVECFGNVLAKGVTCTSWTDAPTTAVVWVGPKQVTHGTLVRHFLNAINGSDVIEGVDGR